MPAPPLLVPDLPRPPRVAVPLAVFAFFCLLIALTACLLLSAPRLCGRPLAAARTPRSRRSRPPPMPTLAPMPTPTPVRTLPKPDLPASASAPALRTPPSPTCHRRQPSGDKSPRGDHQMAKRAKQPYDAFLVLDVEATCIQGAGFDYPNEIIVSLSAPLHPHASRRAILPLSAQSNPTSTR